MKKESTPFRKRVMDKLMALLSIVLVFCAAIPAELVAAANVTPTWPVSDSQDVHPAWPAFTWPAEKGTWPTAGNPVKKPTWTVSTWPEGKATWPGESGPAEHPTWPGAHPSDTSATPIRTVVLHPVEANGHASIAADLLFVDGHYGIAYEGKRYGITPYAGDTSYDSLVEVGGVQYKFRLRLRAYER